MFKKVPVSSVFYIPATCLHTGWLVIYSQFMTLPAAQFASVSVVFCCGCYRLPARQTVFISSRLWTQPLGYQQQQQQW